MKSTKPKTQYVTLLGQKVRVGTKKHAILEAQLKHFNDLAKSEIGVR